MGRSGEVRVWWLETNLPMAMHTYACLPAASTFVFLIE